MWVLLVVFNFMVILRLQQKQLMKNKQHIKFHELSSFVRRNVMLPAIQN